MCPTRTSVLNSRLQKSPSETPQNIKIPFPKKKIHFPASTKFRQIRKSNWNTSNQPHYPSTISSHEIPQNTIKPLELDSTQQSRSSSQDRRKRGTGRREREQKWRWCGAFEGAARLELLTRVPAGIYDHGDGGRRHTERGNERKRSSLVHGGKKENGGGRERCTRWRGAGSDIEERQTRGRSANIEPQPREKKRTGGEKRRGKEEARREWGKKRCR